jgi:hypothetical protein
MKSVSEAGGVPDLGGCYRAAIDQGKTTADLGLPLLSDLAFHDSVELANPEPWIKALHRKAAERQAWRVAEKLRIGVESGLGIEEIGKACDELRGLDAGFETSKPTEATIAGAIGEIGIDVLLACPRGMIASPWSRLNELTNGGPRPGELWLIGARPGVGKTTMALQWAITAAGAGHRVLFASLEMPRADLLKRALSAEGDIPHGVLCRGDLDSHWRNHVAETIGRIGDYPLEISDKLRALSSIAAKVAATPGLDLLVIDYLGLVEAGHYENRTQEVSAISRRLKLMAMDYGISVIAAHQLNRSSDAENRPPRLSDLRDSGSCEQDSDVVLLISDPSKRNGLEPIKRNRVGGEDLIQLLLAKQRNGVSGYSVDLQREGRYCRMKEAPSGEAIAA